MKLNSRVFVYGTLRSSEVNHHLLKKARYCGPFITQPHYKMFDMGAYPGVVRRGRTRIHGEVYEVDSRQMADLDQLEGYPTAYTRRLIRTPWGRAWIYLIRDSHKDRPIISSGIWRDEIHRRRWSR
jgi:gamma-glutamylaminecyclotransferase